MPETEPSGGGAFILSAISAGAHAGILLTFDVPWWGILYCGGMLFACFIRGMVSIGEILSTTPE